MKSTEYGATLKQINCEQYTEFNIGNKSNCGIQPLIFSMGGRCAGRTETMKQYLLKGNHIDLIVRKDEIKHEFGI